MNLQSIRGTATGIAHLAGVEVMRQFNQPHVQSTKSSVFDVVTESDKASEALIVAALMEVFPDHHIVGEEGGGYGAPAEEAEYFWYIDPIDGTVNYANNIPHFAVSIALADRYRNPLVGVVLAPATGEVFSTAKGYGATRNGKPIHVSDITTLEQAVVVTGFPYDTVEKCWVNVNPFLALLPCCRGVRRFGSAALDLSYVACGRFESFWEPRLNPWDCMAGILLVREAGGRVTDFSDGENGLDGSEILASNGHLHSILREYIVNNP